MGRLRVFHGRGTTPRNEEGFSPAVPHCNGPSRRGSAGSRSSLRKLHRAIAFRLGNPHPRQSQTARIRSPHRKLEIYDSGRYFTITGRQVPGNPFCCIQQRQEELDELIAGLFKHREIPFEVSDCVDLPASDSQLVQRANAAKNGARFSRLWDGDTSEFGGDHSRADLALCRMLSFWCRGDFGRVDRLFRQSGLMRDKWDRIAGGTRYAQRTILVISTDTK